MGQLTSRFFSLVHDHNTWDNRILPINNSLTIIQLWITAFVLGQSLNLVVENISLPHDSLPSFLVRENAPSETLEQDLQVCGAYTRYDFVHTPCGQLRRFPETRRALLTGYHGS